jgi:hypothetical protein
MFKEKNVCSANYTKCINMSQKIAVLLKLKIGVTCMKLAKVLFVFNLYCLFVEYFYEINKEVLCTNSKVLGTFDKKTATTNLGATTHDCFYSSNYFNLDAR